MVTSENNFEVVSAEVTVKIKGNGSDWESVSEARVKIKINGNIEHKIAEGNGPLNALDNALRKALPWLSQITLSDYAVNVFDGLSTEARVKVFIWFLMGEKRWTVEEVSTDIINASLHALVNGYKMAISDS